MLAVDRLCVGRRHGVTDCHSAAAATLQANYSYSDANKKSGIVWNEETFKEYIKDPKAKIPGTKMIFAGIKNETDLPIVDAVIAEVFARSNALRREIFGNLGRAATAKDVATRMREHLADLRKHYSAKTPRRNHAHG